MRILRTILIYTLIVLLLSLSLTTVKSSNWIYTTTLTDSENDNGNNPGYTDLIKVEYGYNETFFNINITVKDPISLNQNERLFIGVLIDTDINQNTGYRYPPPNGGYIGADKYIEVSITSPSNLGSIGAYRYTVNGNDWSWEYISVSPGDLLICELQGNLLKIIASRGVIGYEVGEIKIVAIVTRCIDSSCNTVDYLDEGVRTILPIPEPAIMIALATMSIAVLMVAKKW